MALVIDASPRPGAFLPGQTRRRMTAAMIGKLQKVVVA
jgi:hypothetical protein